MKLNYLTSKKINHYAKKADSCMRRADYQGAIKYYEKILDVLPEPKDNWEAYDWTYASIGDTYFFMEDYEKAFDNLKKIVMSYDNPYIYMRYGQCFYYMGDKEKAEPYLIKAYQMVGDEVFETEDDVFKEIAMKEEEQNEEFDDMFGLPLEYTFLEKRFLGLQYLWDPIDWEKIYINCKSLFNQIPKELYENGVTYFISFTLLESVIFLGKKDEIKKWLDMVVIASAPRKDSGATEIWQGISEYYLGNEDEALKYFERAEEKGVEHIFRDFYDFRDEPYKIYKQLNKRRILN